MDEVKVLLQRLKTGSKTLEHGSDGQCPICGGVGAVVRRDPDTGEIFARDCECETRKQNLRRIRRSGLEDVVGRYTLDAYQTPEPWQKIAKEAAARYIREKRGWFFVGGNSGIGKTHLCTAICADLMDAGLPVRYMQWRSEVPGIKAKANDAEEYEEVMGRLKRIRVLYVDDFLKGSITEADKNVAFDLLNSRYNDKRLLTIISSEMTLDKILRWDEAIGGRIAERGGENVMNFAGKKNWRLK